MSATQISAVMFHVSNVAEALAWYESAFPQARRCRFENPEFEFLVLGETRLEFVPSDAKVASGAAGTVVYWSVPEFQAALNHFLRVGAKLYRGPMQIENDQAMCQVRDPWGNCIGLRGSNAAGSSAI